MMTTSFPQVLAEYEAEIQQMHTADPSNESILKLKSDIEELISMTKADLENKNENNGSSKKYSNLNTTDSNDVLSKEKIEEMNDSNTGIVSFSSSSSSSGSVSYELPSVDHKQKQKKNSNCPLLLSSRQTYSRSPQTQNLKGKRSAEH